MSVLSMENNTKTKITKQNITTNTQSHYVITTVYMTLLTLCSGIDINSNYMPLVPLLCIWLIQWQCHYCQTCGAIDIL